LRSVHWLVRSRAFLSVIDEAAGGLDLVQIDRGHVVDGLPQKTGAPSENAFGALMTDIAWPVIHDADGEEVQLTLSNYSQFRRSNNRTVRRDAVTAFFGTPISRATSVS